MGLLQRLAAAAVFGATGWNEAVLDADVSDSTAVVVTSGLEFTPEPNSTYIVEVAAPFTCALTTIGLRAGFYGLTSGSTLQTQATIVPQATTTNGLANGGMNQTTPNTTSPALTSLCTGRAMVTTGPTPVGTISLRFCSSSAGNLVTIKKGATIRWRKVL